MDKALLGFVALVTLNLSATLSISHAQEVSSSRHNTTAGPGERSTESEIPRPVVPGSSQCESDYRDYGCEAFKNSLPAEERHKVVDCRQPKSLLKKYTDIRRGCEVWAPLEFFKGMTWGQVLMVRDGFVKEEECTKNLELKRHLLAPVDHALKQNVIDALMTQASCRQIKEFVRGRIQAFERSVGEKKIRSQDFANVSLSEDEQIYLAKKEIYARVDQNFFAKLKQKHARPEKI